MNDGHHDHFRSTEGQGNGRMIFAQGRTFTQSNPEKVKDFLRSRTLKTMECSPDECRISSEDGRLVLQRTNGIAQEWPMRMTFFEKLLRWYHIPPGPLCRMPPEAVVPLLNGVLGIIRGAVNLTVEDGDALTITSMKYNRVSDLEVLDRCAAHGLTEVTRSDFFMRAYFEARMKTEPKPGDVCAFGYHALNSETGFMALTVSPFVLRLLCTNGAVYSEGLGESAKGLVHYGAGPDSMEKYLEKAFRSTHDLLPKLARFLNESVQKPSPKFESLERELDVILGFPRGRRFLERFERRPDTSLYDIFNFITSEAQKYMDHTIRFRLEEYAGNLLKWSPPRVLKSGAPN